MKKLLSVFLAFAFVVGVCFSAPFTLKVSAASVSSLTFKLNSDGKSYCVSDCNESVSGDLEIPSTYNGLPVTSIGSYAFGACYSLTSITIPNSVTSIGNNAFRICKSLTSITIPDSVTSIAYDAFYNCISLTSVNITNLAAWCNIDFGRDNANPLYYAKDLYLNGELVTELQIPEGVTQIKNYAFYNCTSLTSITIPDSVTSIGNYAFYNTAYYNDTNNWENDVLYIRNHLIEAKTTLSGDYVIKSGTKCIASSAFYDCTSLTSITIPDSVTSIGSSAFYNTAYYNDTNNWENNVLYIGNHLIKAKTTLSGEHTIKTGTKCIAGKAFYDCTSLTSITIPDSVTSIGEYAFYNCTLLTSITIPDSVTSIGNDAFRYCTSLTSVNITNLAAWCNIDFCDRDANPLYYAEDLYLNGKLVTELQIPEGVTQIRDYAFMDFTSLTSVTIPDSVTSIGSSAFRWCSSLTSITIPDSVTSIGSDAFEECTSLTSITIPDSVTSIGSGAFGGCTALTSITIGDSVTSIGDEAFSYCTSLTSITIPDSVTSIGSYAFYNCGALNAVYISDVASWCNIDFGDVNANPLYYAKNLYLNKTLVRNLIIPEGVKSIKNYAFYNAHFVTGVKIPKTLESVGIDAFSGCSSIAAVAVSDLTTWLNIDFGDYDANPLYYARDLYLNGKLVTELQIPEGVTQIKDYAFYNCKSLTSITIPDNVTSIGYSAFYNCTSLTSITIPDNVTSIGYSAFYNCTSLTSITIPDSVTSIGNNAFRYCTSLTSVTIGDSVTSIGDYAFYNCDSLTSIKIGDSVTSIGEDAFYNCKSLTSIIIPESVTSIGNYAFSDCASLKYVFYPGSYTEWSNISIGDYNSYLTDAKIHYNSLDHEHVIVKNSSLFDDSLSSIDDVCTLCGHINSSKKLTFVNSYINGVDTKNVVLDTEANMLLLDISACTDISDAIIEMDGYTITAIPNSSHGFIGTGSKLKVSTTSGTQVAEYTLVVRGDVNGDSVCDVLDCMLIELARNNQTTLEGAYYAAANLAEDDRIDMDDFSAVVNRVLA